LAVSIELLEAEPMALKDLEGDPKAVGPMLVKNLFRLGFADIVVRSAEIARLVEKKTGKTMTRQRISAMMNAVRVEPETIELLAKAIGVKPAELLKDIRIRLE
jgi:hypothetical protein